MKLNVETPIRPVDINRLEGPNIIEMSGDELVFGVLTRMGYAVPHQEIVARYPVLSDAL